MCELDKNICHHISYYINSYYIHSPDNKREQYDKEYEYDEYILFIC